MVQPRLKILMVEDYPSYALLTRRTLEQLGWEVVVVPRISKALELIESQVFDGALVDLGVEDSAGIETFRKLRAKAPRLPIVVLTGMGDEALAMRTVQEGAQDFITKGDPQEQFLPRTLGFAIERMRVQEQLAAYAEELRLKNQSLNEGLLLARQVQRALLPPGTSGNSGPLQLHHRFLPTESVGGDFFSITTSAERQTGLLLCDVMGHGVRAALITGVLRAFVAEHSMFIEEPASYLARANRTLRGLFLGTGTDIFVTGFVLVADAAGRLRFASAGHPSPLMVNVHNQEVAPVSTMRGPPMGLLADPDYVTERASLHPGQRMLLFTDGLYEAHDPRGQQYGLKRLGDALRLHLHDNGGELVDALLDDVRRFASPNGLEDDVCLIVIDWLDELSTRRRPPLHPELEANGNGLSLGARGG